MALPLRARGAKRAKLPRAQHGMVLGVALMILGVMMMIGLATVREVAQGTRLVSHGADRSLAFQAADSSLREIEQRIELIKPEPLTGGCPEFTSGPISVRVCTAPAITATPRWLDPAFTQWEAVNAPGVMPTGPAPDYLAEYLGNTFPCGATPQAPANCRRYRVTARAGGGLRARAMVQSIFATP